MTRTYYHILGCLPDATEHDIKRAYRRLSKRYHPDLNPNDPKAAERFIEMQNAYEVLGDPESRAAYDFMLTQPAAAAADTNTAYAQETYTQSYYPPPPKRPFGYAFVPGIDIALFIAVFRMIGDHQMNKLQSSKFTYASVPAASPVFNNNPAGDNDVFQPNATTETELAYYGQVTKLQGRLEYRFVSNPGGQSARSAFVLILHKPVDIKGSPVVNAGKKISTVYLDLDRKQREQFTGLIGKNIVVMATLQPATTMNSPADATAENVSVR